MTEMGRQWEGRVVNGEFPLLRYLGSSDHSAVFLTDRKQEPKKAAIKLIPASGVDVATQLADWQSAAKLSHPHILQLFETGRCQMDGKDYLYVVMEFADEDLCQILPERPLTAAETREMLPPLLRALRYLHGKGFVHGHLKPANIMAIEEHLKISSDGVVPTGRGPRAMPTLSPYDPPEAAGASPAGDVWSLGITLVEVLMQRPPVREATPGGDPLLPQSLPMPFAEIARHCLRRSPEQRWSFDQIGARLKPGRSSTLAVATGSQVEKRETPGKPLSFGKPAWLIAAVVFVLMLLVLAFVFRSGHPSSEQQQASPSSAPAPVPPTEPGAPAVVQQVVPEVSSGSRATIQGTIRVKVRVTVDSSGNVSNAAFLSAGPSQYFANLALQSARKWKFTPAQAAGSNEWNLTFEFRQSGTHATASLAKPQIGR